LSSLSSTIITVFAIAPEPSLAPLLAAYSRLDGDGRTAGADRTKNLFPISYRNENLSLNSLINRKK